MFNAHFRLVPKAISVSRLFKLETLVYLMPLKSERKSNEVTNKQEKRAFKELNRWLRQAWLNPFLACHKNQKSS